MTIRTYQFAVQAVITPSAGTTFTRSVSDAAVVSDSVSHTLNLDFQSVDSDLDLFNEAIFILLPGGINSVNDDLSLVQEVAVFGYETVEQDLALVQTVEFAGPLSVSVNQTSIFQAVSYSYGVRNFYPESELGLSQEVRLVREFAVTDNLNLVSEASAFGVLSELSLTDEADWGYGYDASHKLGLTQLAEVDKLLNQTVVQSSVVSQASTYFIESPCSRKQYNTFHGTGGTAPSQQRLNYASTFLIQSLDDGTTVELRNPETDDRRRYAFNRVNRAFFDGSPDIYADDDWVTQQTQIYTLVGIKRSDLDTLHTFLTGNLGRQVLIKDWKGVSWIVIISNPGEVYTEDSEGYWTIDFEVIGEPTEGEYLVEHLDLSNSLSRSGSIWTRSVSDADVVSGVLNRDYDRSATDADAVSQEVSYTVVV